MPHCNICQQDVPEQVERAQVRSNVRKFRNETFRIWRCPKCQSIHASDEVDLAHYYRDYPFHHVGQKLDWMLRAMYRVQLKRLRKAGFGKAHKLLDYGCGSGGFVRFLREEGYENAHGFDEYSPGWDDKSVLSSRYDFILSQDVLEHVPDPWTFLRTLRELVVPGGVISLGTPNAEAIDLANPEARVHTLHQPYHRNIFSKQMLVSLGDALGWQLSRYYPTMYANTLWPFINQRFVSFYFKLCDDTLDLAVEPIQVTNLKLYNPVTLFFAFFGYFFAPQTDVTVVYKANP